MLTKLAEYTGEGLAQAAVFLLAFSLSTGLTCNGKKVSCDQPRDEAAEVSAP